MAQDTAITAVAGAPAIGPKLQVYQREINFATTGLASGDHFELFDLDAGDVVIAGGVVVTAVAGAGNEDLTIGVGGTGTELLTATPVDTSGFTAFTLNSLAPVQVGDDTVDLAMTVDAADRGTVLVTMVVLKAGDFAG
jgi:hypothetical protein